ncbi:XRE family transcriptional regulator [Brevibacillus laterosporus]|uniref:XRE family transcriptional regulator n=1 Tax=Brevibacillus laterosporus TaxID=1465 RepID=A0A518V5G4_BRELA|nr:XRE family transcriptional regulator [Brevibacillus laterosporus]
MIITNHALRRSLRYEITARLKAHEYTISKLSELANINNPTLSIFLKGVNARTIRIEQLDAIAIAFNESPGWLYETYLEECFSRGRVYKRRVCPFLIRCVEIGRYDCIYEVVSRLLDMRNNIDVLFDVAEQLFQKSKQKESIYFYKLVIETEKNQWSESFIMSQYRLFRASLGTNVEENWNAIIRFEAYQKRLPENHQLDALLHLAHECFKLRKWKEVEDFADELRKMATLIHQDELGKRKRARNDEPLKTERHLVVYYGQGYLLKAASLEKQKLYGEARKFVSDYLNLSWIDPLNKSVQAEVHKYKISATANLYRLNLLIGDICVLDDYITFLKLHPSELVPGLVTIMKAANKHDFLIDDLLKRFSEEIRSFDDSHDPINVNQHLRFRYYLATYHFQNERFESGIKDTLRCLDLSIVMNNQKKFIQCVILFEAHRYHAKDQQIKWFKKIMEEVKNDKSLFAFEGHCLGLITLD